MSLFPVARTDGVRQGYPRGATIQTDARVCSLGGAPELSRNMIPSSETIERAREILETIERLQTELAGLFGKGAVIAAPVAKRRGRPPGSPNKSRQMSVAGRAAIAAAAKARWARFRSERKPAASAPAAPAAAPAAARKKRKMSAEGRARIVAAAKARWAKVRAEAKKA